MTDDMVTWLRDNYLDYSSEVGWDCAWMLNVADALERLQRRCNDLEQIAGQFAECIIEDKKVHILGILWNDLEDAVSAWKRMQEESK
jgi:hypothetical protein